MISTEQKIYHAIADWVGDAVAQERYLGEVMDHQPTLPFPSFSLAKVIRRIHDTALASKQYAESHQM